MIIIHAWYNDRTACTYYDQRVAGGLFLLWVATALGIVFLMGGGRVFLLCVANGILNPKPLLCEQNHKP